MRFVRGDTIAGELRAQLIADHLGVPCSDKLENPEPGEWVVFVKTFDGISEAKRAGCMVAFDPVDFYGYPGRDRELIQDVDLLIVPNRDVTTGYKAMFPRADFMVVPHQWDHRIEGQAPTDRFIPGYVGQRFNLRQELNIPIVSDPAQHLSALPLFNCHFAEHATPQSWLCKPATKVAAASAVGAVIVTDRASSALELLGPEYPFYSCPTLLDGLWKAKKAFGQQAWEEAQEIMRKVKERTSLESVANLYKVLS